jgi:hypothetical protein
MNTNIDEIGGKRTNIRGRHDRDVGREAGVERVESWVRGVEVEQARQREDNPLPHDADNTRATSTKREVNSALGSLHNSSPPRALPTSDTTLRHLW